MKHIELEIQNDKNDEYIEIPLTTKVETTLYLDNNDTVDVRNLVQKAVMAEIRALRNENEDAKQLLKEAQHNLHMCNGVFVPSNDKANKYIADLCRMIEEFLNCKADNQADIESKNMLRKARDAASERALMYAAKAGELELENAALKIRLEQEGIEV